MNKVLDLIDEAIAPLEDLHQEGVLSGTFTPQDSRQVADLIDRLHDLSCDIQEKEATK